jgi:hypothetical protein
VIIAMMRNTIITGLLCLAASSAQTYKAPRTVDGKPNLNGIWQAMNTADWDLEGHAAAAGPVASLGAVFARPPGLGVVDGDEIPYLPAALAKKKANQADWVKLDPEVKCYLPGVPRATYLPYPFLTSLMDTTWFDHAGNYHSDALHVVERFTPRSADTLNYEATIEDPKVFSRPWKISMPLYRHVEKNDRLLEYKCVEFAEEIIYGPLRKKPAK